MKHLILIILTLTLFTATLTASPADAEHRSSVTQYGITWTFDKPYPTGQFVNGDWWVVGPVTIKSVTPNAGPAGDDEQFEVKKNQFGDTSLQDNDAMRNGSMIVLAANTSQGYDSRKRNYDPELSVAFPCKLPANRSLVSTISNKSLPNKPLVPFYGDKTGQLLKTAAVLTCLDAIPPADAFRPAYAGTTKTIYRAGDLKRDLLPDLTPLASMPDPDKIIRIFQRPWLDHAKTWLRVSPVENNPTYGREVSRAVGFGACMLLLDIDPEKKEQLLINFVQVGIDLYGLSENGMHWQADGGHYSGRKYPIMFAGLMLGNDRMLNVVQRVNFHEDQQTYYGKSFWGHTVLWQMVVHHGPRQPFEEKDPATWDKMDQRSNGYRTCCNGHSWIGYALAARYMKLIEAWNHDAFFDYCERWMDPADLSIQSKRKGNHTWDNKATDKWITDMWLAYRAAAPEQPNGKDNKKWIWQGNKGKWIDNPKPQK